MWIAPSGPASQPIVGIYQGNQLNICDVAQTVTQLPAAKKP